MSLDDAGGASTRGAHILQALGLEKVSVSTIEAVALQEVLAAGTAQVVDLNWSRHYYQGHIPGAWFAIRARLRDALKQLPSTEMIVLTSPDGVLAQLAAADLEGVASLPIKVLSGGTQAWRNAGLPLEQGGTRLANEVDDIRLRAREESGNRAEAMRAYLAWEIELFNQMTTEEDHRFFRSRPQDDARGLIDTDRQGMEPSLSRLIFFRLAQHTLPKTTFDKEGGKEREESQDRITPKVILTSRGAGLGNPLVLD